MRVSAVTRVGTLLRTVVHLRPQQIAGRVWHRLYRPRPRLDSAPPASSMRGLWVAPARRAASMVGPDTFRFLNDTRSLAEHGWDDRRLERLWRYNLHYFDDLNATAAGERKEWHRASIMRWIAENPPGQGTAWEPYPTSLRIVNWIKWLLAGNEPVSGMLDSLAVQARWLARRIEWHLLGNHLFVNAKALVFAGTFFSGDEAGRWRERGASVLLRELPEQVLVDGGHFERSPMYHALALEDVLDLVNLLRAHGDDGTSPLARSLLTRVPAMLHWLRCMSHPDGGIALFNDAAEGIAPANAEIEAYASRLGFSAPYPPLDGVAHLAASGYVRVARGAAVAIFDCAPIGPDYLPGHAHADTLSFELSVNGRRIVVNGGTSCYGTSAQRVRERGTGWHSTVQVADCDSSEVWSGFRVGRRARPGPVTIDNACVECSHDGYRFLAGSPRHHRRWCVEENGLRVEDWLTDRRHMAVARFHLAPGIDARPQDAATRHWVVDFQGKPIARCEIGVGSARVERSEYAPQFGTRIPIRTLAVQLDAGRASVHWRWNS